MNSPNIQPYEDKVWEPVIEGAYAVEVVSAAVEVANRCFSIQRILKSETQIDEGTGLQLVHWISSDTAGGASGLSMFATYLHYCFPNQHWQSKSHALLMRAVESFTHRPLNPGYYSGTTGIAFAVLYASENGSSYDTLLKLLDQHISMQINAFLEEAPAGKGVLVSHYDLISGATGYAAYLLIRTANAKSDLTNLCSKVLRYLVDIIKPKGHGHICFIEPKNIEYATRLSMFPQGYQDYGMAHGVAGIMAVLALAVIYGWNETWIMESLQYLSQWFVDQKYYDKYGANWPAIVGPGESELTRNPSKNSRLSWCYGLPGKSRALYLAGKALGDDQLVNLAFTTLDSLQNIPRNLWGIKSPNICHGLSGMLQVYLRMYNDTKLAQLKPFIAVLVKEIMACYKTDSLFGFQDTKEKGIKFDNPRLLNGAPGVALSLLAAVEPVQPIWDHLFLLS